MIEDFHFEDANQLLALMRENFPEEERVYGTRPDSWNEVVKRVHRPSVRILVALARLARRPIYRFFTIKDGERLVATSIVSFAPRIGYISTVMVDAAYRRRGFARRLLARCHQEIAAFHRPNAVLDVLSDNQTARALYLSEGYRSLRTAAFYTLPLESAQAETTQPPVGTVRAFRKSDRGILAPIADAAVPAEIARVLPPAGRRLNSSMSIDQILGSESASWVLEESGRPRAWVAATTSAFMEAAGFPTPIIDPAAHPEGVRALLSTAVEWCRARHAERIVCRVPNDNPVSLGAIEGYGFRSSLSFETLYRPLP